jgi:16S rRNA (cytidine1402-2'-O)-methyltransferase
LKISKKPDMANCGTLYLIATPIGNLEDLTFRALEVLRKANLIAAEDTRHAGILLQRYDINQPVVSYYEENEVRRSQELLEKLLSGQNIALITDAGTPLMSDPGYHIVRKAIDNGIPVVPIPGPSSILTALMASGLATDRFTFEGFCHARKGG